MEKIQLLFLKPGHSPNTKKTEKHHLFLPLPGFALCSMSKKTPGHS
jgi:hypothetical protein